MPEIKSNKKKSETPELFPEFMAEIFSQESDSGEMTVERAKELVGWEEEGDKGKFGDKYDLLDMNKKKIRLNFGQGTPFKRDHALGYAQEILNKRWRLTGCWEVGKCGTIHSGRHRAAGLILAEQIRIGGEQSPHWMEVWPGPITIPCVVHYGIDDDDDTVNSIDIGNPRNVTDMLFRSDLFKGKKKDLRLELSKCLDWAIRVVWERTGAKHDPWAPRKTHSEIMDFVSRHKSLLRCVEHIVTDDGDGGITTIVKRGIAAGYMYLMCASLSNGKLYGAVTPSERKESGKNGINFKIVVGKRTYEDEDGKSVTENVTIWDKAEEFWVAVHSSDKLVAVNEKIAAVVAAQVKGKTLGGTVKERVAIVLRAWNLFVRNKKISLEDLDISDCYKRNEEGKLSIEDNTIVGGIDFGPTGKLESPEEPAEIVEAEAPEEVPVDPKKVARASKVKKILDKRKAKTKELAEEPDLTPDLSDEGGPSFEDLTDLEEGEDEE